MSRTFWAIESGSTGSLTGSAHFSCTADIEGDDAHFIFGGKYGYGICNRQTGDYHWIKKVWNDDEVADGKPDRMRGNDGAVDSRGRFWVGFMNDPMVKEPVDEGTSASFWILVNLA